jgi:5-(aminomethyl)-3-furanmethanol phosphate kinase
MRRVVVKVGGSLLSLPDLADRLRKMFAVLNADRIFVVCGGGQAAELVRNWDLLHRLDEEVAHWLAIDSMALTASLLAGILPETMLASNRQTAESNGLKGGIAILVPRLILDELHDGTREPLPIGWDCTSDSIAGWIATQWKVDAIVLAKSVDVPVAEDFFEESTSAAVDPCFNAVIAGQLPVYWCNVRGNPADVVLWKKQVTMSEPPSEAQL